MIPTKILCETSMCKERERRRHVVEKGEKMCRKYKGTGHGVRLGPKG